MAPTYMLILKLYTYIIIIAAESEYVYFIGLKMSPKVRYQYVAEMNIPSAMVYKI